MNATEQAIIDPTRNFSLQGFAATAAGDGGHPAVLGRSLRDAKHRDLGRRDLLRVGSAGLASGCESGRILFQRKSRPAALNAEASSQSSTRSDKAVTSVTAFLVPA